MGYHFLFKGLALILAALLLVLLFAAVILVLDMHYMLCHLLLLFQLMIY